MQDNHPHLMLFFTLWAAIGPLAGILIGHLLTRSWQREQWRKDKRWQEYRELLSAVTTAYMALIRIDALKGTPGWTRELSEETNVIKHESFRVIRDRLIIAEEIGVADVLGKWDAAVSNYDYGGNVRRLAEAFTELNELVIHLALHPPLTADRWRLGS